MHWRVKEKSYYCMEKLPHKEANTAGWGVIFNKVFMMHKCRQANELIVLVIFRLEHWLYEVLNIFLALVLFLF